MKSPKTTLLCILFICTINKSYSKAHLPAIGNHYSTPNIQGKLIKNTPLTTQSLRANLYAINADSTISLEDGNLELYGSSYCDCVNWLEDAPKMTNILENFAIERDSQLLSIEKRQPIGLTDTVFYNMTHMEHKSYYLSLVAINLNQPNLFGFLQDSYTGASTPINLNGTTTIPFSVTADQGSAAPNRFQVIYTTIPLLSSIVPVTYTGVKAWQENKDIAVEWQVDNQSNTASYEVEKSTDGVQFNTVATIVASGTSSSSYNWVDMDPTEGNNFYRIEEIDNNGGAQYSKILEVAIGSSASTISVYPNPVVSGVITMQMENMASGTYGVRLLNNFGQAVFTQSINHQQGSAAETITVGTNLSKGVYRLQVIHPDNSSSNTNVVF